MNLTIPGVEKRLQVRYQQLVGEHSGHAHPVASGPRILPNKVSTQAAAMAAWRFYLNPRTTFTRLAQPLLQAAAELAHHHCQAFALVPLDWSRLDYGDHPSKTDRTPISNRHDLGYKLLSALLLNDQDGQPLAPLCAQLQTAEGLLSSRFDRPRPLLSALDELAPLMAFVQDLPLGKPPVFVIDAEADSVDHYRKWDRRGFLFLVRADGERYARLDGPGGAEMRLADMAARCQQHQAFPRVREVPYEGRLVGQFVAEVRVILDRPACQGRTVDGKRQARRIPGQALPLRLVISELRDEHGQVLQRWYLLTNLPETVTAATIARWYLWRWRIESFFKLVKSAGQEVEHWQQEKGRFILKRLLIASMACVLAWRLNLSQARQADEARRVVMGLSGRQREHGKTHTLPGLLAGIWVLLAMAALLEQMPPSRLQELARFVMGGSVPLDPAIPTPLRNTG